MKRKSAVGVALHGGQPVSWADWANCLRWQAAVPVTPAKVITTLLDLCNSLFTTSPVCEQKTSARLELCSKINPQTTQSQHSRTLLQQLHCFPIFARLLYKQTCLAFSAVTLKFCPTSFVWCFPLILFPASAGRCLVDIDLPARVDNYLLGRVDSDLPARVDGDLPRQVDSDLPGRVDSDLPGRVDNDLPGRVDSDG